MRSPSTPTAASCSPTPAHPPSPLHAEPRRHPNRHRPCSDREAATCWITAIGNTLYASNTGSGTLSGYRTKAGKLTALGATGADPDPVDAAASSDGANLYVQTGAKGVVDVYRVHHEGSLAPMDRYRPRLRGRRGHRRLLTRNAMVLPFPDARVGSTASVQVGNLAGLCFSEPVSDVFAGDDELRLVWASAFLRGDDHDQVGTDHLLAALATVGSASAVLRAAEITPTGRAVRGPAAAR